ncbi:MAG: SDR family oxidoreductase [Pseudomonadota bacterium]
MEPISKPQTWDNPDLYCSDLPTRPLSAPGKILVTGASGYIGGRLVPELLARGYQVRIMVRGAPQVYQKTWPETEVVVADAAKLKQLPPVLKDIDTAYYLIHSLRLGPHAFRKVDIKAAKAFRMAAEEAGVKRIVYLGGLGDIRNPLSLHLRSRIEIANELKKGRVPLTVLRAAIIIGSGSASYEIIQHLVQRLPIIFLPHWMKNRCQPIAIRDVIKYLVGALEMPETTGKEFDIGGPDILTYEQMLKTLARILDKKVIFFSTSFSYLRFYCYLVSLFTPVPHQITKCLMEGLKNEVVVHDDAIRRLIPFEPLSYQEAIDRALTWEKQDQVSTRWSDAYPSAHALAPNLSELKGKIAYQSRYSLLTFKNSASLFQSICRIGGKEGWFHNNWMWRLRGMVDRMLLGVGSSRGRKRYSQLNINDVIDFWRVEDLIPNKRLLLRAEMKLPGKAWLEFQIEEERGGRRLSVIPYFDTQTLLGKMYWYIFLPFHHFIFKKLIVEIDKRS